MNLPSDFIQSLFYQTKGLIFPNDSLLEYQLSKSDIKY